MSKYIAHDGENVWGIGESEDTALSDGKYWLHNHQQTMNECLDTKLVVESATDDLCDHVDNFGGAGAPMFKVGDTWDLIDKYRDL